ncbi:hypothetical protein EIN_149050 [Entamoeba invadens IP1]|uniref:DUF1963 domain-containing protein n=1 Tax=Entamoeba invadens IP1 TaxID=370355 RepID=L7FKW9_ENTIV|nr:hypothetical protein EIN_149050 [Entamoeba invadens IP1]ELP85543.1 hypothetical protein EIN_149050 [Entamoeba invadens IP1]|eukprot:XP_004184889.1 hypothetical protein EIN_149050 [Entamoeba invadens IP1]
MPIPTNVMNKIVSELISIYKQPYIDLKLEAQDAPFYSSKIGGLPYFPKGSVYPQTPSGEYMYLLAQINFSEMPALENFPRSGLLQFFLFPNRTLGLFNDDGEFDQKLHKVVYYEKVDMDEKHQNELPKEIAQNYDDDHNILIDNFPFDAVFAITGDMKEGCSFGWYKADQIFERMAVKYEVDKEQLRDAILSDRRLRPQMCSLGGYPSFAQTDPRKDDTYGVMLLQIETTTVDDKQIMWGDCGVGNFFISKENLKNKNFDDVLYNYDCC